VQPTHATKSVGSSHDAEAAGFSTAFAARGYGYSSTCPQFLASRQAQFPQLSDITYLDHAAATLCSKQQLEETQAEQLQQLLANPHSQLPAGLDHSAVAIEELRLMTLHMLNAPAVEYEVRHEREALASVIQVAS
jgi:selenocysteine lyase/cysteine desulfurase